MIKRLPYRRAIRWESIQGPRALCAFILATALGSGLFPLAPGTMGTLLALPIAYFTAGLFWPLRIAFWTLLTLAGIWAAKTFDELMESQDNQNIVIDEVIGFGISTLSCADCPKNLIAAFIIFRLFDILKPPPIRNVDRWSKKQSNSWWQGFGVIADDILAGFFTLLCILLLQYFKVLPS